MRFLKGILSLLLVCTAYIGDFIVFKSTYSTSLHFRAVTDSIVHGSIGFLSALIFFTYENQLKSEICALNVIFCTFISSFIDVDHFIVARSIYLKDLRNLKYRGLFHNTAFCLLLSTVVLAYSYINNKLNLYVLSFMLLLAFTSHHIRDGNRRGLCFYPYGSSPPIDKNLYILFLAVLPHVISYFYLMFKGDFIKNVSTVIVYVNVFF